MLLIEAAKLIGIDIPVFCYEERLKPVGACRMCLVQIEKLPRLQTACTTPVAADMVVHTLTDDVKQAQNGVLELLLANHPLDCPICDKGGECPLQNQALASGRTDSRFTDPKRTFAKPIPISTEVLLDRERCVLCARCTRFSEQIAGDEFIEMLERGPAQQVGVAADKPFQSYFSGNTIQICPVGALTSAAYRFRSRPFDLVSTPGVCEHCASGCALRTDWRRGIVLRRLAGHDPQVNEEWNCDKGRFAFTYASAEDRITRPLIRESSGELRPASWTEALQAAAQGLLAVRDSGVGVLPGGRLTVEDAFAYAKFARVALSTNDIDFRARPHSAEELDFLAAHVVGVAPDTGGVSYEDLSAAPAVACVAFEPEEESPIVYLRLRRAARERRMPVWHLGQFTTPAVRRTFGTLLPVVPGAETEALDTLDGPARDALCAPGAVLLVGERAAEVPGLYSAVARLAANTGARMAWIPRRAGERGALDAGAVPTLLPGGRPVTDPAARAEVERAWGVTLPSQPGRDTAGIIAAAAAGQLGGLVIGGVDPGDLPDPQLAEQALSRATFVVSLEMRPSAVSRAADVVLPIASALEKAGSYLDWEGRRREFGTTISSGRSASSAAVRAAMPDCRVLDSLAVEMHVDLFTQTPAAAWAGFAALGSYAGARLDSPQVPATPVPELGAGQALLATWRRLLDNGSMQDGEPQLAGTARAAVALLSAATAADLGVHIGGEVTVSTQRGSVTLPAAVADLPPGVVWVPGNSGPATVRSSLGAGHGSVVTVRSGNGKTAWGDKA
jgi:NADH-quinone oxidoreductase subunit G